jgi:hypothetical protein
MYLNSFEYAPYFREGLLYLPPKTVALLIDAGLCEEAAEAALNGLALDDDRELIGQISNALEKALAELAESSPVYQVLHSQEVEFLLTGRPMY